MNSGHINYNHPSSLHKTILDAYSQDFLKEHQDTPYGIRLSNTLPEECDARHSFPHYALCAVVDKGEDMLERLI